MAVSLTAAEIPPPHRAAAAAFSRRRSAGSPAAKLAWAVVPIAPAAMCRLPKPGRCGSALFALCQKILASAKRQRPEESLTMAAARPPPHLAAAAAPCQMRLTAGKSACGQRRVGGYSMGAPLSPHPADAAQPQISEHSGYGGSETAAASSRCSSALLAVLDIRARCPFLM